jgi:type IV secretory pathway TraG/TraD family ATPase VirD4
MIAFFLKLPLFIKFFAVLIAAMICLAIYFVLRSLILGRPTEALVRGVSLTNVKGLNQLTRSREKENASLQLKIGDVYLPTALEGRHIFAVGTTGVGKSTLFRQLLKIIYERGARAIVADLGAEFRDEFARVGDRFLHPGEPGTVLWNPIFEIQTDADVELVFLSIVPAGNTAEEEVWRGKTRDFLKVIAFALLDKGELTLPNLRHHVVDLGDKELQKFFVENGSRLEQNSMTSTVRSMAVTAINAMRFCSEKPNFSIRQFVRKGRGVLYLCPTNQTRTALAGMINGIVNLAIAEMMSSPSGARYNSMFLMVDEVSSFEIGDLQGVLEKGRKYNLTAVCGMQTIAQLRQKFGPNGAAVLLSCFRTKIIFNPGESETAMAMSGELGKQVVEREARSHSKSGDRGSVSTTTSTIREERFAVSADELLALPDLSCYVKFIGDYPVAKTKITRE